MKHTIKLNFFSVIVILIVGSALFKDFDKTTNSFQNTALAILYVLAIIIAFVFMLKKNNYN